MFTGPGFPQRRSAILFAASIIAVGVTGSIVASSRPASSRSVHQSILIDGPSGGHFTAGSSVACTVQVSGGDGTHVTIYSNPAGVNWSGNIASDTETVSATSSSTMSAGSVTLYVICDAPGDDDTPAYTTVVADNNADTGMGGSGGAGGTGG